MTNYSMFMIYFMMIYLYTMKFKKFLMMLISVEILMFTTSIMLMMCLKKIWLDYTIIYFLVLMVSESVLGLSLLIIMSRIHKNDSMSIMEMSW